MDCLCRTDAWMKICKYLLNPKQMECCGDVALVSNA